MLKINLKNKVKNQFNIIMKKLLVMFIILTNLFFYMPVACFAADSDSDSEEEKFPAMMPVAADSIISKYVNTNMSANGSSSSSSDIITDNSDKGDGWDSVTKVTYPNGVTRTYRNYKQYDNGNNTYWDNHYWDGNIASDGCGPSSVAIVLSGYGYEANPGKVVDVMHDIFETDASDSFEKLRNPLKHIGNIEAEDHYGTGTSADIQIIRDNFKAGRPVIVNVPNHYVVYLGEDENGKLIISDPGANDGGHAKYGETLEDLANNGNITCGYILIKSDGSATTSSNSTKNSKKSKTTDKKSSSEKSNTGTGSGKVISTSDYNSQGGYSGVYESRTTGKKFKEYKQNSSWAISKFPNVAWKQECGMISALVVSSGYTEAATYSDLYDKMNNQGYASISATISAYTNIKVSFQEASESALKKALVDGCVAVVHLAYYPNTPTHYISILDISEDQKKIYISDPWGGTSYNGWQDISMLSTLGAYNNSERENMCFVSSDGKVVNYSGDGYTEDSFNNTVDMSSNIVDNGHGGYKVNIDLDKEIDEMLQKLKLTDVNVDGYLTVKNQKEYLKDMIKAAIVTQYPDLRSANEIANDDEIPTNEIQGCVKIKRYADGETKNFGQNNLSNPSDQKDGGMYLSYKKYKDLEKMINDGDKSALNYFSLDSSNNIVVAGWETMDVDVDGPNQTNTDEVGTAPDSYKEPYTPIEEPYEKLTMKKVAYLNQVSNYSMPFSLMWTLLVYGHDEKFVDDFAKLVIDTDIVIGCYDATNVRVTTHEFNYSKVGEAKIDAFLSDPTSNSPGGTTSKQYKTVTVEYKFKVTETDTIRTDTPSLNVIYADTWTAVYNKNYKVKTKTKNADEQTAEREDEIQETNHYQIKGEKYSGDRKPDDDELTKKIDSTVEEESDTILDKRLEELSKEVEQDNKKIKYKYDAVQEKIDKTYSKEANGAIYDFLNIKDVQSQIINMIIEQDSQALIESVFSKENALMLKYAKSIDKSNYEDILKLAVNAVKLFKEDKKLYKKITKDETDYTKAKTYTSNITSIQVQENKKKTKQKEKINQEITTATVEEVASSNGNVRFKVNKKKKENSFVKLLANSQKARGNLQVVESWFFDSLEDTAAIADLEDLLKYLFQCAYKTDYGISDDEIEELADMFDPNKMATVNKKQTSNGTIVGGATYSSLKLSSGDMEILYKLVAAENSSNPEWTACCILNRILSSSFPNTMKGVAFASGQFEVTWNGMYDAAKPSQGLIDAVNKVLETGDITGGAIGFQTIELYDSQYPRQTWETPIELLRERYSSGDSSVYFTTASIQKELAQYSK